LKEPRDSQERPTKTCDNLTGNDAFSGITADLLQELAKELVCDFVMVLADRQRPETSMAPLDALQFKKKFPEANNRPADMAGKLSSSFSFFSCTARPCVSLSLSLLLSLSVCFW
jgi:hypothetical protein